LKKRFIIPNVLFLLLLLNIFCTCEKDENINPPQGSLQPESQGQFVNHQYYSLAYSEPNEGAIWVFYHLTPYHVNGPAERKDNFKIDPLVSTGSAELEDYVGSGYDLGHLCPAGSI